MTSDPTCTAAVLPDSPRRLRARPDMQQTDVLHCNKLHVWAGSYDVVPYVRTRSCLGPTCLVCSVYRLFS